ncbi:MAG: hypothetical protein AB8B56_00525, partial [Crocinitomicaceae bacterium]
MRRAVYTFLLYISFASFGQTEINAVKYTYQECSYDDDSTLKIWTQDINFKAVSEQYLVDKSWHFLPDSKISTFELSSISSSNLEEMHLYWSNPINKDGFYYDITTDK